MDALWARIEAWLQVRAPRVFASLQAGASAGELRAAEAALGVILPDDVRASYRRHNGQALPRGQYSSGPSLIDTWDLLPLDRLVQEWAAWKFLLDRGEFSGITGEPDGPVRDDWWHPRWIPVAHDAGGNSLCLDLAPARGGAHGQLITLWHDDADRAVVAPSFRAWLAQFADALERNEYAEVEGDGGLRKGRGPDAA